MGAVTTYCYYWLEGVGKAEVGYMEFGKTIENSSM